ncbi:MAG: helix-turn-helix domain-containing protein [Patescibacteria group bacterium]|jgi:cytoskeletal protein RodZ
MSFFVRNLKQEEGLGEKIRALRKHKNITLNEVVSITKIQKKHLEAFESGRYDQLPEPIYAKNFLRKYIQALGGDPNYFVTRFEEETKKCDLLTPHRLPVQRTRAAALFASHRLWKLLVGLCFVGAIIFYLGWQVNALMALPEITVFEPLDGIEVTKATITVKGKVDREAEIFVNNDAVVSDIDGNFSTEVTLERGLNIITIEANTRHSKKAAVYRKVVLKQE